MDNLEEYIMKHREELDRYNPSSGIRKRIGKGLKSGKKSGYRWISVAAMIAVILGSAVVLFRPGSDMLQEINREKQRQVDSPGRPPA